MPVPLIGTLTSNRWGKFWRNLGFGAFLNAVGGKRLRKTKCTSVIFTIFLNTPVLGRGKNPDCQNLACVLPNAIPNDHASCKSAFLESGKKKQHKHKHFGPDFPRTFLTLTPECPGVKKLLPTTRPQENALFGADVHDFRRGRP